MPGNGPNVSGKLFIIKSHRWSKPVFSGIAVAVCPFNFKDVTCNPALYIRHLKLELLSISVVLFLVITLMVFAIASYLIPLTNCR